jgi:hypothetical protein
VQEKASNARSAAVLRPRLSVPVDRPAVPGQAGRAGRLRILVCPNQSVGKLEAAIKRLSAAEKRKLVGTTSAAARKLLRD